MAITYVKTEVSNVNEAPSASITKHTYVSDIIFGNFLLTNTHNCVMK
jgi:hypothetical protein